MNPQDEDWIGGNRLRLLENGEEFFPAVFAAIESARHEVLLETFILFEDKVGLALHAVLLSAARRGVRIDVTIDGFGSPTLSSNFVQTLKDAGVRLHVFDPPPRLSRRLQPFMRLHRKIVVVDNEIGFIGGINYSADHLGDFGSQAKQDYAVEARGPIVASLRSEAQRIIAPAHGGKRWWHRRQAEVTAPQNRPAEGRAEAKVITRDNFKHRDDIERYYRFALHTAQREVIIANAYFFPGYRLMRSMQRAAQRGVQVHLILQGHPDIAWAAFAARMTYHRLIRAGVHIHEYCERPIHAKVALVDEDWSTVGSSNLDPLSLSLNLEANLVIRDQAFNQQLRGKLKTLIEKSCKEVRLEDTVRQRWWWRMGLGLLAFHVMRHFPRWASLLPARRPKLMPASETGMVIEAPLDAEAQPWPWRPATWPEPRAARMMGQAK